VPNEKMQPIQWTEWPTGALVAAGSLWPLDHPTTSRFGESIGWQIQQLKRHKIMFNKDVGDYYEC
jgi:hypothetical protein